MTDKTLATELLEKFVSANNIFSIGRKPCIKAVLDSLTTAASESELETWTIMGKPTIALPSRISLPARLVTLAGCSSTQRKTLILQSQIHHPH
ncbi:hypothetical protein ACUHGC_08525 [Testudinibacter sp. P27/CKL/0425]